MRMLAVLFACGALAGCGPIPRDPDGTLDRIRREHRFQVGIVDASGAGPAIVRSIARETRAAPVVRRGQLEPLLLALEAGELDLVIGGRFSRDTPWKTRVTLGPPLREVVVGDAAHREHLAARNGENAWIMLVQRAVKAAGGA